MAEQPDSGLAGRRVAVTGATGFIGAHTVVELVRQGAAVVAIDVDRSRRAELFEVARSVGTGDVTFVEVGKRWPYPSFWWDGADARAALTGVEALVHLGYAEPVAAGPLEEYEQETVDNVVASIAMLRRLPSSIRVVVAAGSAVVYGRNYERPVTEGDPIRPDSPYGRAKADLEQALGWWASEDRERWAVSARLATVYGPTELVPRAAPNFIRSALAGSSPEVAVGGDERDYIHATDAGAGLAAMAAAALDRRIEPGLSVFNLGTGRVTTTAELARLVVELVGSEAEPVPGAASRPPVSVVLDPSALEKATGFVALIEPADGLADEIAWFRRHPQHWSDEHWSDEHRSDEHRSEEHRSGDGRP